MDSVWTIVLNSVGAKSGMRVGRFRLGRILHTRLRMYLGSVGDH